MKGLVAWGGALAASVCWAEMEFATPESQGVDSAAIANWIRACERTFDAGKAGALHGFTIVRHGKTIAEGSWKPFDTLNETHMLYSHSKSFTATAVGFLVDEGKLDLDERLVDIFRDELPDAVSAKMLQMRVRDLLTMNDGMNPIDVCTAHPEGDWVKAFLSAPVRVNPGERFKYDSSATYMLASVVERRTGRKLLDFLDERLFSKLGIRGVWTTTSPQGTACGGWGMNMTTRDLAKFGQLYLQKGVWNGEHLLSPDWVTLASTRQTWSGWIYVGAQKIGSGTDWEQGYGFQFWRCRHNCYRADGAAGQLTVVMPDQDAVVSVHAGLGDMQKELDLIWDILLPAMKPGALPEDAAAQAALREQIAALAIAPLKGVRETPDALLGDYAVAPNLRGVRALRLTADADGWQLRFCARSRAVTFPIGFGTWKNGSVCIDPEQYESLGALIGTQPVASSGAVDTNGALCVRTYLTGTPAYLNFRFSLRDGRRVVDGDIWGMHGSEFHGEATSADPQLWGRESLAPCAEEVGR